MAPTSGAVDFAAPSQGLPANKINYIFTLVQHVTSNNIVNSPGSAILDHAVVSESSVASSGASIRPSNVDLPQLSALLGTVLADVVMRQDDPADLRIRADLVEAKKLADAGDGPGALALVRRARLWLTEGLKVVKLMPDLQELATRLISEE